MIFDYSIPNKIQDKAEVLIALGLYKSRSEEMKNCLKKLRYKYTSKSYSSRADLRKKLDKELGHRSLSKIIFDAREEELH